MLEFWLKEKPGRQLMEAWKKYTRAIWEELTETEKILMRQSIMERRGRSPRPRGLPGVASISSQEKALLEELEKVLS